LIRGKGRRDRLRKDSDLSHQPVAQRYVINQHFFEFFHLPIPLDCCNTGYRHWDAGNQSNSKPALPAVASSNTSTSAWIYSCRAASSSEMEDLEAATTTPRASTTGCLRSHPRSRWQTWYWGTQAFIQNCLSCNIL
jgi:hypothetical protein